MTAFEPGEGYTEGPIPLGAPSGDYEVVEVSYYRFDGLYYDGKTRIWHRCIEQPLASSPSEP